MRTLEITSRARAAVFCGICAIAILVFVAYMKVIVPAGYPNESKKSNKHNN